MRTLTSLGFFVVVVLLVSVAFSFVTHLCIDPVRSDAARQREIRAAINELRRLSKERDDRAFEDARLKLMMKRAISPGGDSSPFPAPDFASVEGSNLRTHDRSSLPHAD